MAKGIKTGGRKPGTPNKRTETLCEILDARGINIPQMLADILPNLDDRDKVKVLLDLLGYQFPKRKAIEHSGQTATSITFEKLDGTAERYTLGNDEDET